MTEGVRVTLQTIRGVEASVYTDTNGRFEFTRLVPGKYQVLVEADPRQFEPASESLELVRGFLAVVNITLKEKGVPGRPKAGTISTSELDSSVPANARKEFELGTKAYKEGHKEEAIAHLRKAVALYPQYLSATNDLGAQLLELGRLDEAETLLRRALEIDPAAFNPNLNLGIVLVRKHEFQLATEVLQKAVSMQPQSPDARLYFGLALVGNSEPDRAEREFLAAYDQGGTHFAVALYHLGQLNMDRGDRARARDYFQRYLRDSPNASNVDEVRKLIAMLE